VPEFHSLEVSAIDRLTDDSVAISLAVPEELRAAYCAFLRARLDGSRGWLPKRGAA